MSRNIEQIEKIRNSMIDFNNAWLALTEAWEQIGTYGADDEADQHKYDDAINDILCKDYPFVGSFDEMFYDVHNWVFNATIELSDLKQKIAEQKREG